MKVQFIDFNGEVLAIFPNEIADYNGNLTCYAHIGQHSACHPSLLTEFPKLPYTDTKVKPLLRELELIGYNYLEVL